MADYLASNSIVTSIEEKQEIFRNRARMTDIKINYPGQHSNLNCRLGCTEIENYEHIGKCSKINSEKLDINMQQLWNGDISQMKKWSAMIKTDINKRNKIEESDTNVKNKDLKTEEDGKKIINTQFKSGEKRKRILNSDECTNKMKKIKN